MDRKAESEQGVGGEGWQEKRGGAGGRGQGQRRGAKRQMGCSALSSRYHPVSFVQLCKPKTQDQHKCTSDLGHIGHSTVSEDPFCCLLLQEGELRPQLLDRFGMSAQVQTLMDVGQRTQLVLDRIAFEADPEAFVESCREEQEALTAKLTAARERLKQ